jgi:hypothetical protein
MTAELLLALFISPQHELHRKHPTIPLLLQELVYQPLPSNSHLLQLPSSGFHQHVTIF